MLKKTTAGGLKVRAIINVLEALKTKDDLLMGKVAERRIRSY